MRPAAKPVRLDALLDEAAGERRQIGAADDAEARRRLWVRLREGRSPGNGRESGTQDQIAWAHDAFGLLIGRSLRRTKLRRAHNTRASTNALLESLGLYVCSSGCAIPKARRERYRHVVMTTRPGGGGPGEMPIAETLI